jgi:hypothetical protein
MPEQNTPIDEGKALGDDLATAEPMHRDEGEAQPALDEVPENPDDYAGDEVESDFDPDVDYEEEVDDE